MVVPKYVRQAFCRAAHEPPQALGAVESGKLGNRASVAHQLTIFNIAIAKQSDTLKRVRVRDFRGFNPDSGTKTNK